MSMDLTGITNQNEYYTNHYFSSIFEENASDTISRWRAEAKDNDDIRTPWALLRDAARQYYPIHDRFLRSKFDTQTLANIRTLADVYLSALGYPEAKPEWIDIDDATRVPVYLELKKPNGAPALWVLLATSEDREAAILDKFCFSADNIGEEGVYNVSPETLTSIPNEDLITKTLFGQAEPPRFVVLIGMNQIALIDRNKWNEKRYLQFELEEIFSRHEESTLQAMAVLLHRDSLCPEEGTALLDELDANSQKHAAGVSQDLKYALRESIELLGNEVLYDMAHRLGRDLDADPVDAGQLTLECLRYMYRMLFVLFIEARPELGYAPIKAQSYLTGYSLESLRDIADDIRDDVNEVGDGYYLHETLSKLYGLIYDGYPKTEEEILKYSSEESLHDMFVIAPLKAHIFDPEYTKMITNAKLRNRVMLRIIDLMSLTRETGRRNDRRGRISYANLGINQMGSVYEALLSYRGFIAEHTLFEVKRAGDSFNELDVGYFVAEEELDQYDEDERVRYERDDPDGKYKKGQLRRYEKGTFIYRLAGREREKSASYYTPEVLTKCLVKYALKELLEGKTADEILQLTICEPAMGSAAFLNEAINQLAEAYIDRKQKELGEMIPAEKRLQELQKVKMYIADRNVYGIDLNPVAVELAEVSLWLNTIYEGGFVPWFGTQLVNGNSLIGARRQCYSTDSLVATSKGLRWYEKAPDRVLMTEKRKSQKQIYHFLLGDPGMCSYSDKVIKSLEPENIKKMAAWNKKFTAPYTDDEIATLRRLSGVVDELWEAQVKLRQQVEAATQDNLSVYGHIDTTQSGHTTIRQKDKILSELYKSEHMRNAGPYARLKFAMDYWCALWFWPIDKADLLPSRSEFLFDLSLILEGTMGSVIGTKDQLSTGQYTLEGFDFDEAEQLAIDLSETYAMTADSEVDIPALRKNSERLDLAAKIAEQNHFMHWELEFADLFKERGGFDLILGNPPWIKMGWSEQDYLSDIAPIIAIRKLSSSEADSARNAIIAYSHNRKGYTTEYANTYGQQAFLNAVQNYFTLAGMKANLYKCFLPQAVQFANQRGVFSFVHPDGVFDDPNGGALRRILYPRLRMHFQFINERKLFEDVHHNTVFSVNVYCNIEKIEFIAIFNLFTPNSVDDCFSNPRSKGKQYGMKTPDGEWNTSGTKDRLIKVTRKELRLFSELFDEGGDLLEARLPSLYVKQLLSTLSYFNCDGKKLGDLKDSIFASQMINETLGQKSCAIKKGAHFPETLTDAIYSGSHIGNVNPMFKTAKRECRLVSDFECPDLTFVPDDYLPRFNYSPDKMKNYLESIPLTPWGANYCSDYRLVARRMLDLKGEKTVMCAIIPPNTGHINGVYGWIAKDRNELVLLGALLASIPYDFLIKTIGKDNMYSNNTDLLPMLDSQFNTAIKIRYLRLNCLNNYYKELWLSCWHEDFTQEKSAFDDCSAAVPYSMLSKEWSRNSAIRNDLQRRHTLIEIDVLVAMALGMSLEELKTVFRTTFYSAQQNEANTWYDTNGRIVYTGSRSMSGVGVSRQEWDAEIKILSSGSTYTRTILDDTIPGGPVERTIEYVAPFGRCDREQDYETAWKFFEEKYGKAEE